jgi:hypothetical protein
MRSRALTFLAGLATRFRRATVASSVFNQNNDGTYSANANASVLTNFLGVMGTSSISIDVSSQAIATNAQAGQFCLLALSSSAHPAIQLTGNAAIDVNAPQCVVQVNSNSASAVTLNGNTSISSSDNCFVGSVVKVGNATLAIPSQGAGRFPIPSPTIRSRA